MLDRARALRNAANCEFELFDGEHLPFASGTFDAALTGLVLWLYFEEPNGLGGILDELGRVLRPGGQLLMIERVGDGADVGGWTIERWRSSLASAGLELTRVTPVRQGKPSRIARLARMGVVPNWMRKAMASADFALARRRGLRAPYTECLIEARRV
jgi:SAM-dependent methyltransferase